MWNNFGCDRSLWMQCYFRGFRDGELYSPSYPDNIPVWIHTTLMCLFRTTRYTSKVTLFIDCCLNAVAVPSAVPILHVHCKCPDYSNLIYSMLVPPSAPRYFNQPSECHRKQWRKQWLGRVQSGWYYSLHIVLCCISVHGVYIEYLIIIFGV